MRTCKILWYAASNAPLQCKNGIFHFKCPLYWGSVKVLPSAKNPFQIDMICEWNALKFTLYVRLVHLPFIEKCIHSVVSTCTLFHPNWNMTINVQCSRDRSQLSGTNKQSEHVPNGLMCWQIFWHDPYESPTPCCTQTSTGPVDWPDSSSWDFWSPESHWWFKRRSKGQLDVRERGEEDSHRPHVAFPLH